MKSQFQYHDRRHSIYNKWSVTISIWSRMLLAQHPRREAQYTVKSVYNDDFS